MKDQSIEAKRKNAIQFWSLDSGVCVFVFGIISKLFTFYIVIFPSSSSSFLSSVIPKVKTSADELHKHLTHTKEKRRNEKKS